MALAPLALGQASSARYQLERELGRGGMATVYLARDLRHGRQVALKLLRPELSAVVGRERFAREIAIAAQLNHPHILPLHDSGSLDLAEGPPLLFYAMPYVAAGSLRERLRAEPQLPLEEALRLTHQVAEALEYAHRQGIIHRDIKPENILLAEGEAVVADFGIARALDAAGSERLTETGLALGTPAYMSPEQAAASPRLDARSDLYALGCVLYEMLAGQPPFTGPSSQAILARHAVDPVPALRTVRPTVPLALEQAVTRALAKVPADRFPTVRSFADALTASPTTTPATAGPTAVTPTTQRDASRRRRWLLAGGALAVFALAASVLATIRRRPRPAYLPGRVVVAPIENQTGDSSVTQLTHQLLTTLPDAIAHEGVADPVPAATVRDLLTGAKGSPGQVAERLSRETGAGLEVRGVCTRTQAAGTTCEMDLLRMPAKLLRFSVSATGDPANPSFGSELTERVLVALLLQKSYGDRVSWQGEYVPRFLGAARAFEQGSTSAMLPVFSMTGPAEAARIDTNWVDAIAFATEDDTVNSQAESTLVRLLRRPGLLSGERENVEYQLARRRGDPERAFQLAQRRFSANYLWWCARLTFQALLTRRARTAVEASGCADTALAFRGGVPDGSVHLLRGYALHQLGRYREELQLAGELQRRFPTLVPVYRTHEIMALAALGQVDSVRRRLAEWEATPEHEGFAGTRAFIAGLELMAHGHEREGREILAGTLPFYRRLRETAEWPGNDGEVKVLMWTGKLEEAQRLALAALQATRGPVDSLAYLTHLGEIAASQGTKAEAARYDRLLAAERRPELAAQATGDRALIASRLGDREGAVRLLEQALARGDGDSGFLGVHRDPNLAPLRGYAPFERFLEPRD